MSLALEYSFEKQKNYNGRQITPLLNQDELQKILDARWYLIQYIIIPNLDLAEQIS
jgi:hypothetical protein